MCRSFWIVTSTSILCLKYRLFHNFALSVSFEQFLNRREPPEFSLYFPSELKVCFTALRLSCPHVQFLRALGPWFLSLDSAFFDVMIKKVSARYSWDALATTESVHRLRNGSCRNSLTHHVKTAISLKLLTQNI